MLDIFINFNKEDYYCVTNNWVKWVKIFKIHTKHI